MTCRHEKNDPSCSSHRNYREPEPYVAPKPFYPTAPPAPLTPDPKNYAVERVQRVGKHLVMRVKYPNCAACAFEGSKVMVFLNVVESEALLWRQIDPHFRDVGTRQRHEAPHEAPSPAARFPATTMGWADALDYAGRKA